MNNKLKKYRLLLNVTQKELANKIGVTQASISQIESGERYPTKELLDRICKSLNRRREELSFTARDNLASAIKSLNQRELNSVMDYIEFIKYAKGTREEEENNGR